MVEPKRMAAAIALVNFMVSTCESNGNGVCCVCSVIGYVLC